MVKLLSVSGGADKALPSGFLRLFAKFFFSRKVCWLYFSLAREGKPQDTGDSPHSFFKDESVCLQGETQMLLSCRRVETTGGRTCPAAGILFPGSGSGRVTHVLSSCRFTSTIAASQRRRFLTSTVPERNFESSSSYTSCRHMTMR